MMSSNLINTHPLHRIVLWGSSLMSENKWTEAIYGKKITNPEAQSVEQLTRFTTVMLEQHYRIINDSVQIVQKTKYEDTRQGRISLCRSHYQEMLKLEPFCNAEQKAVIERARKMLKGLV